MAKRLREYVKYTTKELEQYTQLEGSCVHKINTNLHISMGPFCLADFKHFLGTHLVRSKVGFYDIHLHGIVLGIKNIKVLGKTGAMRADDPKIHININADVYVFKPVEGAELTGIVKHIGPHQVGVIIYRVFNANLRVAHKVDKSEVQMDQEVKFRVRKYNLQNVFPYIDGELLTPGAEKESAKAKTSLQTEDNGDSGIEEKEGTQELQELLSVIKIEAPSEYEEALGESNKRKSKKFKKIEADSDDPIVSTAEPTSKKSREHKKSKTSFSTLLENATDNETAPAAPSPIKIKYELPLSEDCLPSSPKKLKKDKDTKKIKTKKKFLDEDVEIKEEIDDGI